MKTIYLPNLLTKVPNKQMKIVVMIIVFLFHSMNNKGNTIQFS